jgi:hypothetical protein
MHSRSVSRWRASPEKMFFVREQPVGFQQIFDLHFPGYLFQNIIG